MMRGYHNQYAFGDGFGDAYQNNGWNYSLFAFNDYSDPQTQNYQYDYSPQVNYHQRKSSYGEQNSPYIDSTLNTNAAKSSKKMSTNMLKAKKSGRVFYPSKVHHSRHNSQDDQIKGQRDDLSPLNRSHDSTCGSSSGQTDSSSKNGSGVKLSMTKASSERVKDIIPIKLNFEDEPAVVPTLIVEVVSSSDSVEYELEQNDVKQVFEKFGPVSSVEIHEKTNKAVVTMEDPKHGQQAEKYLNFYQLPNTNAYLTVKWQFGDFDCLQRATMLQKTTCNQNKIYQEQVDQKPNLSTEVHGSISACHGTSPKRQEQANRDASPVSGASKECTSVSKFTCKYEVPIKNLPGFSVARKIIGRRGRNMKMILEKLKDKHFSGPIQDVIKLRLRGQGSGFKEGPQNCESPEPLHLCVSSKYYEKYNEACKLVEKLLRDLYTEYNNYCKWRGRPVQKYKINKMENSPACYLSNYPTQGQQ